MRILIFRKLLFQFAARVGNKPGLFLRFRFIKIGHGFQVIRPHAPDLADILGTAPACEAYPQFKALDLDGKGNAVLDLGERRYRGRIEIGPRPR